MKRLNAGVLCALFASGFQLPAFCDEEPVTSNGVSGIRITDESGKLMGAAEGTGTAAMTSALKQTLLSSTLMDIQKFKTAGDFKKAEETAHQAMKLAQEMNSPSGMLQAKAGLAGVYRWEGRGKEAAALYDELEKQLAANGMKDSTAMATILDNHATLLDDMNDDVNAAGLRSTAIAIYEKAGPSEDLALVYQNQAANMQTRGNYSGAENVALKAMMTYHQLKTKNPANVAVLMDLLGSIYYGQKKFVEAEKVERSALKVFEEVYGSSSPDVSISLNNLAGTCVSVGKYDEAKSLIERSVAICKKVYGPNSPQTQNAMKHQDNILKQIAAAEKH